MPAQECNLLLPFLCMVNFDCKSKQEDQKDPWYKRIFVKKTGKKPT